MTFYVARPRRKDGGGASAGSSRHVHHHHHHDVHHHHHHHLLHHGSDEARRRGQENRRSYDRRAELLEYSRQMRATAAAATARPVHPEEPLPSRRDVEAAGAGRYPVHPPPAADPRFIYIAGLIESLSGGAVRLAGHPPAAGDGRTLVERRRLERAESQQQVRQRCLGLGGDWSWRRVLRLVLPCQSSTGRPSTRSRTRGRDDNDGEKDGKAARAWPAAVQLVSKLKVNRTSRRTGNGGDEGLLKKLFSTFQRQRSRPGR